MNVLCHLHQGTTTDSVLVSDDHSALMQISWITLCAMKYCFFSVKHKSTGFQLFIQFARAVYSTLIL